MFDVAIIGGGITGCAVAWYLTKYELKVVLVEKEEDVATGGATKANSAIIHAGYDAQSGSLKAKLNVRGNSMYEDICRDLDIPFKRIGSLVLAFSAEQEKTLEVLYDRGIKNGVPNMRIINKEELRKMEPNVSDKATAALYAPTAGIICPYESTIAFFENALNNGAKFEFNTYVESITKEDCFKITTNNGIINSRYIINAAGTHADEIAAMAGCAAFTIRPRRGEYVLLDKAQSSLVSHVIFQVPTKYGKGILVSPTVDDNLIIGPTALDIEGKDANITTAEGLEEAVKGARKSVPGFDLRDRVTNFAGVRAVPDTGDFIIGEDKNVKGFINAAGIESPGLTSAPAIAEMVTKILADAGLELKPKTDYIKKRRIIRFRTMTNGERNELIKSNPQYGKIICRCETVTEGEIVDAIKRGARSVDGVKRRTRAGMGRCQGGFCGSRVTEILSRELHIPMVKVTKNGGKSFMLVGRLKDFVPGGEKNE